MPYPYRTPRTVDGRQLGNNVQGGAVDRLVRVVEAPRGQPQDMRMHAARRDKLPRLVLYICTLLHGFKRCAWEVAPFPGALLFPQDNF
jgi:hypothetical protein